MKLSQQVLDLADYVRSMRRDLHRIPELAGCEFKTQEYLYNALKALGHKPVKKDTGLIVDIKGVERKKKIVALRADMDALPVLEQNDADYKSTHEGVMHACGHDGHLAMLLGIAKLLTATPRYNVRLIFQPAEEGEGGAERLIEQGALRDVGEIYALHLSPDYPVGTLASDKGAILAGAVEHDVFFYGKQGHCADAEKRDALEAANYYYTTIRERMKAYGNALLYMGKMSGGTARNVVAGECVQGWTMRYFSVADKEAITLLIAHTLNETNDRFGTEHRLIVNAVYPPVVNATYAYMIAGNAAKRAGIPLLRAAARYTAEDFAFYAEKTYGCLLWLGCRDDRYTSALHSETFDFDESALLYGVELYKHLVT